MPCESDSYQSGATITLGEYKKEIDKLTRLLCKLCRKIEKHNRIVSEEADFVSALSVITAKVRLPKDVREWWKKHKKLDAKRPR